MGIKEEDHQWRKRKKLKRKRSNEKKESSKR